MAAPQVNGEVPHSAFFDHLLRYPVVSDGVTTVKQNKYGQQGISLSNTAYQTLARPVIPYLAKPYEFVSPYVKKADDIGDKTLSRIDVRFPVVTKPTAEVYEDTKSLVLFPYRKSVESRDHIFHVYTDERKQIGGDGVVPLGKAVFSTALVVTTETLTWFRTLLNATKQQVQEKAN